MKRLLRPVILVPVLAVLVIGAGLAWYFWPRGSRPDISALGGTVLVYEVDEGADAGGKPDVKLLAEALQRRLDGAGLDWATARAAADRRVEILIPRAGDHARQVAEVKDLLARGGRLEFRVLANNYDDKQGIAEARGMFDNPANRALFAELQEKGLPPPAPTVTGVGTDELKVFELTTLPRGQKSKVSYRWVELSPQELRQLNLDNAALIDPELNGPARALEQARNAGWPAQLPSHFGNGRQLLEGALFFSRACKNHKLSEAERRRKPFECFVLARNPEIDPATGKETHLLDGKYLSNAVRESVEGRLAVNLTFNRAGGDLMRELSRKNVPSGGGDESIGVKRHLAIILDGLVMSAPTINSVIGERAMFTGQFTEREVDQMVDILRSGALPYPLKPLPVQEAVVEPGNGRKAP